MHNDLPSTDGKVLARRIFGAEDKPTVEYLSACISHPLPRESLTECQRVLPAIAEAIIPACLTVGQFDRLHKYLNQNGGRKPFEEIDTPDNVVAAGVIAASKGAALRTNLLSDDDHATPLNAMVEKQIAVPIPPEMGRKGAADRQGATFLESLCHGLYPVLNARGDRPSQIRAALKNLAKRDVYFCLLLPKDSRQLQESYQMVAEALPDLILFQSTVDEDTDQNNEAVYDFMAFLKHIKSQ